MVLLAGVCPFCSACLQQLVKPRSSSPAHLPQFAHLARRQASGGCRSRIRRSSASSPHPSGRTRAGRGRRPAGRGRTMRGGLKGRRPSQQSRSRTIVRRDPATQQEWPHISHTARENRGSRNLEVHMQQAASQRAYPTCRQPAQTSTPHLLESQRHALALLEGSLHRLVPSLDRAGGEDRVHRELPVLHAPASIRKEGHVRGVLPAEHACCPTNPQNCADKDGNRWLCTRETLPT